MKNRIITGGPTSNANESSTTVRLIQGRTQEDLYEGKSADINEEILENIEARLASCRLAKVTVVCASNYVLEGGFEDGLYIVGGACEIQSRIAEMARDKMKVYTAERQTTYSLSRDNEELDETIRSTDPRIYESYDKGSKSSSSGQLTPGSGDISDCGPFDDEPAPFLPLEHPCEDGTVDSLSRKSTSGSDDGTSADEIVESAQRSTHSESDALSPERDLSPSAPSTMIITGHGNASIEISNISQGDNAVFVFGSGISKDLMEALLLHRSS